MNQSDDEVTCTPINLLIVDMDGTVREPRSERKFIQRPSDQKLIVGAESAIAYFAATGWKIVGVTNQAGVEAGKKSLTSCIKEQQYTMTLLPEIEEIYFCPDFAGKRCFCVTPTEAHDYSKHQLSGKFRKPNPGMLLLAMEMYNSDKVLTIGDRPEDKQAANSAKIKFQQAENWRRTYGDF